jgi:DNA processing protein
MAVPGNITSPVSGGSNRLIRDGAAPLLEPADLLQHFPELVTSPSRAPVQPTSRTLPEHLSLEEREVAGLFGINPVHPDELTTRSKRSIGEVLGILSGLEIAGVIEQCPGRLFRRI